jgi:hypothetical protein
MPGLVQTASYARELLSLPCGPSVFGASVEDIDAIAGERIKRQDVLYQPDKKILTGFVLYDNVVLIESIVGQQCLEAADEVALIQRIAMELSG